MHRHALKIAAAVLLLGCAVNAQDWAAWMQKARWGVMTHYLSDWKARDYNLTIDVEQWNKLIDGFDVEGLAKQLESVGASYYLITIGQTSGYYLAPNATYDRYVGVQPSHCSRRDLIADLYTALSKRNIKLMVYLPAGPRSPEALKGIGVVDMTMHDVVWEGGRNPVAETRWEEVISDWSRRWGKKVSGWWFDGCRQPNVMHRSPTPPNFTSFAAAARAGNPDSIVAFNPGVFTRLHSLTPEEDYTAGETNDFNALIIQYVLHGKLDGVQVHVLSFLGKTWGTGDPRFTTEQVIENSRKVISHEGAITWDTPVGLNGLIAQPFLDQLSAVSRAFSGK